MYRYSLADVASHFAAWANEDGFLTANAFNSAFSEILDEQAFTQQCVLLSACCVVCVLVVYLLFHVPMGRALLLTATFTLPLVL